MISYIFGDCNYQLVLKEVSRCNCHQPSSLFGHCHPYLVTELLSVAGRVLVNCHQLSPLLVH